jgi:hypothetical protein
VRGGDSARGLDPAAARHSHVEQHQLGPQTLDCGHRVLSRLRISDRLESGGGTDHVPGGAAKDDLVVDSQNSYFGLAHAACPQQ